ncbi:MAG TPA: tripartite tricarboxylate transporter substrate binding protein [Pseudolabrys sp.]
MKRVSLMLLSASLFACCLAAVVGVASATAQEKYPNRPVRVIVPYGPGGATDITARIVADGFQRVTGQPMVVINKPGAYGLIAIEEVLHSTPDGYTVMVGNVSTNTITPVLFPKKLSVDYLKGIVPVSNLIDVPEFLAVTTADNFAPKTAKEFLDYAKKNPGKIRYGSVGVGSYPHYDMAYFAKKAGDLDMQHLPNKAGAAGMVQDILRGDIQAAFMNVASAAGQVQAGKVRPLMIVARERLSDYPNVPTMTEAGYPDVGTIAWNAMFMSAGTPEPVQKALFDAVQKTLKDPETVDKMKKQNFNIVPSKSLADGKTWLAGEMKHWEGITSVVKIDLAAQ